VGDRPKRQLQSATSPERLNNEIFGKGNCAVHQDRAMEDEKKFSPRKVAKSWFVRPHRRSRPSHTSGRLTASRLPADNDKRVCSKLHRFEAGQARPWRCGRGRGAEVLLAIHSLTPSFHPWPRSAPEDLNLPARRDANLTRALQKEDSGINRRRGQGQFRQLRKPCSRALANDKVTAAGAALKRVKPPLAAPDPVVRRCAASTTWEP